MFDRSHWGVRGWFSGGQARSTSLKSKNIGMHGQTAVASLRVLDTVMFVRTRLYSASVAAPLGLHVLVYRVHVGPPHPDLVLVKTPYQIDHWILALDAPSSHCSPAHLKSLYSRRSASAIVLFCPYIQLLVVLLLGSTGTNFVCILES